ncbi:MAG: fibro-slime domain-containing protein [Deltaproteobacteria bacterium]|nr:fibro-slime domain-containing protein [Deltaproteobacteria bacterium]
MILAVFRDFKSDHPDFERDNLGWGPLQGVVDEDLGKDKKPEMVDSWGDNQVVDKNCQEQCPNGGVLEDSEFETTNEWQNNWEVSNQDYSSYDPPPPMYDGRSAFSDWYSDDEKISKQVKKWLSLEEQDDGSYVFDSNAFFPIDEDEGWGAESGQTDANGDEHNFLFTTEVHLEFPYKGGEKFTFRGDDDLWIFVNNKLALDLGGLHWPFEGTIDFDKMANILGIKKGNTYDMDIYHAERHTEASNFRIETNIECFVNVIVE